MDLWFVRASEEIMSRKGTQMIRLKSVQDDKKLRMLSIKGIVLQKSVPVLNEVRCLQTKGARVRSCTE